MAAGQATRLLVGAVITTAITLTCTSIGANLGLNFLAWSVSLAAAISAPLWIWLAKKTVGFHWVKLLLTLLNSAIAASISAAPPIAIYFLLGKTPNNNLLALFIGGTGALIGLTIGIILVRHPMRNELTKIINKLIKI